MISRMVDMTLLPCGSHRAARKPVLICIPGAIRSRLPQSLQYANYRAGKGLNIGANL